MNKKLFHDLITGLQEMASHAKGEKELKITIVKANDQKENNPS